jgi:tight adherence protein C
MLGVLGKVSPQKNADKVRLNLQAAGNPGNMTPTMFSGMRLALAVVLVVIFGAVTISSMDSIMQALMYTGLGAILGYMLPSIWLGQKIKQRKKNITRALPDALDLLTISVEAGLGFDVALQRVTDKWDDELSREFKRVLSDVRLGRSRREGLRDMAERTGVEDIQTFVAAIIQADQLGVSMSKILRLQSDQMRTRRRQRAEEAAQQAPVKMLFPMVFLIFPALFVVILGPAVPRLMESFGS